MIVAIYRNGESVDKVTGQGEYTVHQVSPVKFQVVSWLDNVVAEFMSLHGATEEARFLSEDFSAVPRYD